MILPEWFLVNGIPDNPGIEAAPAREPVLSLGPPVLRRGQSVVAKPKPRISRASTGKRVPIR